MYATPHFVDRDDAGHRLAGILRGYATDRPLIVLGLPRGGVPVAARVAEELDAPLDIFVVRKLGVPGHDELAFGAIGSGKALRRSRRRRLRDDHSGAVLRRWTLVPGFSQVSDTEVRALLADAQRRWQDAETLRHTRGCDRSTTT